MGGDPVVVFPNATTSGYDSIDTPTEFYAYWLEEVIPITMQAQLAGDSPYLGEGDAEPDPDDLMAATSAGMTQYEVNAYKTAIDAIDVDADYRAFVEQAVSEAYESDTFPAVDVTTAVAAVHTAERADISSAMTAAISAAATAVSDTPIAGMVTAYEDRIKKQYLRSISRLASSLSDINAVNSSAFVFGMGSINQELINDINNYDKSLDVETYKQYVGLYMQTLTSTFSGHLQSYNNFNLSRNNAKDSMVLNGTNAMFLASMNKVQYKGMLAELQSTSNGMWQQARVAEHTNQVAYDVHDALFDYEIYAEGYNLLTAASGAKVTTTKLSPLEKGLNFALKAASIVTGASKND